MANLKLNQVIALTKGAKSTAESSLTQVYQRVQKSDLLTGISRTYQPRDDQGETLPPEGTKLQIQVEELLDEAMGPMARYLDLLATVDAGNQIARADVVVDGTVILANVAVTTLLSLEKKMVDFGTVVSKMPVVDPSEDWDWDEASGSLRTPANKKVRTKKIPRNHEKAPATDKHQAQVDVYFEDVVVGDWTTIRYSGALTEVRRRELVEKVGKLAAAIKVAREQANMTEVPDVKIGNAVFTYLGW